MGDVDVKVVEETKVSDSVVEAIRVDVGSTHQAGQDDQVGNSPDDVVADTTLYVLSFCSFSVCLQPKRCDPVVSVNKQYEPFWTAACFFLKSMKSKSCKYDKCDNCTRGFTTENAIMRLVFHDCVRYTDGTGGCDGCLNWGGVGDPHPNPNDVTMSGEYFSTSAQYFQTGSVIIFYTG